MRRRRIILYTALAVFLAAVSSLAFALYTETGTSLIMRMVHRAAPGTLSYESLTGRIGYHVRIEGLQFNAAGNRVTVESADMKWHPVLMIFGSLSIDSLALNGVKITGIEKEKKPVDLRLPRLPRWTSIFRVSISRMEIKNLAYTSADGFATSADAVGAGFAFIGGMLYCDHLNVKSPEADINGVFILDLINSRLHGKLRAALLKKTAGFDSVAVSVNLPSSRGREQVAGPVTITAFAGKKERLRFDCRLGLERQAVRITKARLIKADNRGILDGQATIDLTGSEPAFDISGTMTKLNLAPEIPQDTSLSGDFKAAGTVTDFHGSFYLADGSPGGKDMAARGNVVGTKEIIELKDLEVRIAGGTLRGLVQFERAPGTLLAELTGSGFDPARIRPGLSGNINFRLNGRYAMAGNGPGEGSIKAAVYNSTFQKRPLAADVDARFAGELIKINTFAARGNGFTVNARGTVQEHVTWLARIDDTSKFVPETTGSVSAQGWARWRGGETAGEMTARGSKMAYNTLRFGSIDIRLTWDNTGFNAALSSDLGNRGRFNASALSKGPVRFDMPGQGTFHAEWSRLDLAALEPILGNTVGLKGFLSGTVDGNFLPERRFRLTASTSLADGSFSWRSGKGEVSSPVREAHLTINWDNSTLSGSARMAVGQFGSARADVKLPLPARVPLVMDKAGPIIVNAGGEVNERGLITALFPGMAQETRGQLGFDVTATGSPGDPRLNGKLNLRRASAYLPAAGMNLKDVNADIAFNNNLITITSLTAHSGPGQVSITGNARHFRGEIESFEAAIKGDRFQVVNLPELITLVSPDITVRGNTKKVTVRGSVLIPEALVREERKENMIKPSRDVIIVGEEERPSGLPFALDLLVTVRMGEKVAVKAYGIDTRLAGAVDVTMSGPEDIRARGTITTVEGKYDAYGAKLNVQRGTISFNGPVKEANLNILAVRWVRDPEKGNVAAGVLVTGNAEKPNISLYSRPSMPDMDTLSFIVLGRAGGQGGQADTALLAKAASGLLTGGKATEIQKALGFDVDVATTRQQTTGAAESIVKIGRYISPKLYVSFGRSMSGGENVFSLRYRLTKRLDVESTVGNQTGGAIYYRVEFD